MKHSLWKTRRGDLAIVAVVVAFFFFFFWQVMFGGRFFLAGDQPVYTWPLRTIAWEMIRHGQLPLWTPYLFSGYPLLSMAQLGLGYPLTWGYLFLPGHQAEHLVMFAPYVLAPLFTYAYLRTVGRSRAASLLGGLSFGYGGLMMSGIGLNGMLPNAMMWAPLLLLAVERARTRAFAGCVLIVAGAYSMSILSGIGQGFVYTGLLAAAYAAFMTICWPHTDDKPAPAWRSRLRWRPLAVMLVGMLLAAGVAAFQILETRQAQRLSVRRRLSYEQFSEGAFSFSMAWKSWLDPFHIMGDVTTYVPPLAVLLAIIAILATIWRKPRERRIFFWLAVTVFAWILMCGPDTPFFKLAHRIPLLNLFRVPSRHTFEWTLAASVMAAYGWDIVEGWLSRRAANRKQRFPDYANAVFWLAASLAIGVAWNRASKALLPVIDPREGVMSWPYLQWKLAFVAATIIALWSVWRLTNHAWRNGLLLGFVAIACFFEPFNFLKHETPPYSFPLDRLRSLSPTTKFVQQFPPEQHRVYTQISMEGDTGVPQPRIDLPNITALAGLHNVAGFEPLMTERYSRALNSSNWDVVNRGPSLGADPSLFEPRSKVLDLLNTSFVLSYDDFRFVPTTMTEVNGLGFDNTFVVADLTYGETTSMLANNVKADLFAVVTTLARSTHIPDQTPVALITIHTTDGQKIEHELRAGRDTSEWAHEHPEVKAAIKHGLAPIFDSRPGDEKKSFVSLRFLQKYPLGPRQSIVRVEMTKLIKDADVGIWHATLFDSETGQSHPLRPFDSDRWEVAYQKDGAMVARNNRVLPRAWLATEAEALNNVEIWRRIRGLDDKTFDPRRTALLEIEPGKLPNLPGGELPPDAYARITHYEPNRLTIETNSDRQAVLVVSEMHYPGWVALLDGVKTPIHQTDFLLRGVVVPAGKHTVEMSYRAPQARNGAIISLLTLGLIGWVCFRARRTGG